MELMKHKGYDIAPKISNVSQSNFKLSNFILLIFDQFVEQYKFF